jgi:predicted RNA-binding Zn-ribbon protein involved in translation (DUF1610 family)
MFEMVSDDKINVDRCIECGRILKGKKSKQIFLGPSCKRKIDNRMARVRQLSQTCLFEGEGGDVN